MNLPAFGIKNPVAANLVMVTIITAGLVFGVNLRREFFPEIRPNQVVVTVPYPGASPTQVEDSLVIKIEDHINDIDGIDEIRSVATEGAASITIEFDEKADIDQAVLDVKREIDALQDLPDEAERITVTKLEPNLPTIVLSLAGIAGEHVMKKAIRKIRDDLDTLPGMGDISLSGIRTSQIVVQVDPDALIRHGLSLPVISESIRQAMVELPAGSVRTSTANIAIRTLGADERADDVRNIVIKSDQQGQVLRLGDIAQVDDSFVDVDVYERLNGKPSVSLTIYKVGNEDAVQMAEMVKQYAAGLREQPFKPALAERFKLALTGNDPLKPVSKRHQAFLAGQHRASQGELPGEVILTTDLARFIVGRMNLLMRNALWGGMLVFGTLVLLLNRRVSFWVAVGLVISLLGTLAVMSFMDITLNMLTMFGLIIVLGLLVDDAIIVSENIIAHHEAGAPAMTAAIQGTMQVAWPVIATVLTTIGAFIPLALIQGQMGDMLGTLPLVVSIALGVSLIEALFILPVHMAHTLKKHDLRLQQHKQGRFELLEERFDIARDALFKKLIVPAYIRFLKLAIRRRYATLTSAITLLILSGSIFGGGFLSFTFFEVEDAETINAELRLPVGSPINATNAIIQKIENACLAQSEVKSAYAYVGGIGSLDGETLNSSQTHLGQVILELKPIEQRDRSSEEIISAIRHQIGDLPGIKSLRIAGVSGAMDGPEITLTLVAENTRFIEPVLEKIKHALAEYQGVHDIADDADAGQRELQLTLRDGASEMGFTTSNVAEQIRGAIFGLDAHTFAGNREDIDVRVMLDQSHRTSLAALEQSYLFTPDRRAVPLIEVVKLKEAVSYATLKRIDRKRAITVTAEVERKIANPESIMASLNPMIQQLQREYPSVQILKRGRQKQVAESFETLPLGMLGAALLIYVVLAWLFGSYTQPLVVMSAVPFAIIGVIWGHLLLGYTMTFLSLIGFVALSGVVVNDSLVFIEFYNTKLKEGLCIQDAIFEAGRARIRPIILTTITTVLGLSPLILERSLQARFLIPMAITIAFGLMAATLIILLVLPALLVILDDIKRIATIAWTGEPPLPETHLSTDAQHTRDDPLGSHAT